MIYTISQHLFKTEKGFSEQDLAKSSLFEFDANKGLQEAFRNRLMVPIRDEYGNYISALYQIGVYCTH